MRILPLIFVCILGHFAFGAGALESDESPRAIVVGVDHHSDVDWEIPGVGADIENIGLTLSRMGVESSNITVLENRQATRAGFISALHSGLAPRVAKGARVVVYFSSTGVNTPTGPGILMYDSVWRNGSWRNVLPLSELSNLLQIVPSENVFVLLDVAFRDSPDRSIRLTNQRLGSSTGRVKFLAGELPQRAFNWSASNALLMCPDLLSADLPGGIATAQGGLYTLMLAEAVEEARQRSMNIDFNWLGDNIRGRVGEFVSGDVEVGLEGHSRLKGLVWSFGETAITEKYYLNAFQQLTKGMAPIDMKVSSKTLALGEPLSVALNLPKDGYLNVISIDSNDEATVLYPNAYQADNYVKQGKFELPSRNAGFVLEASEPMGRTTVAAILTDEKINAYAMASGSRNRQGQLVKTFSAPSASTTRAFKVVMKSKASKKSAKSAKSSKSAKPATYGSSLTFNIVSRPN